MASALSVASLIGWVRSPSRRDVALAAVLAAGAVVGAATHGHTGLEAAGLGLLCVPLAVRTRWPLAVLGAVACGAVVELALDRPWPPIALPLIVALYTVGVRGSRRRTLAVAAGLVPSAVVIVLVFSPHDESALQQILEMVSQLGFALAVGEAIRSRREFLDAIRDRAERVAHEHELEARQRVEEERLRMARDVHDVVAHAIATISTQAAVGVHVGREEPERALEALESIKGVSNRALQDLRHAIGALRDGAGEESTHPTPSVEGVPELVRQARAAGVPVDLRVEGTPADLPAALQVAIYRIVQEGLTNVMRHAGGARAMVLVAVSAEEVAVEVRDDGSGTPTKVTTAGTGSGLAGMHERAGALGGSLQSGALVGGGFRVRAVLPRDREPG